MKILPKDVFTKVDVMGAPRLVEYWEEDPCMIERDVEYDAVSTTALATEEDEDSGGDKDEHDYHVKVEARFSVGEYDIEVLSAKQSTGLDRWLRDHNRQRTYERMCGFYGLDLYNLSGSMQAVIDFLEREDPELARLAYRRYGCLDPWADEPQGYGRNALIEGYARCEIGVIEMLKDLLAKRVDCFAEECDEWLDAQANARLVKDAEAYYRVMYRGSAASWNLRDTHMFDTLNMILDAKPNSKAIVW